MHQNSLQDTSKTDISLLLIAIALVTLWRFSVVMGFDVSLYIDEAQYWHWSKNLDFGFYSKPPVVALMIAATTSILGDSEIAVRIGSLLLYPVTSVLVFLIGARLYSTRVGLVAALVFMLMPAVSISSTVISTDVALFFFWSIGLYALIRALENNAWVWWLLLGIAGGLGMQTKYTMGVFVFSAILYLLISSRWKTFLNVRLWVAGIIAALIWLPNLIWNSKHDFITFQHTSEISEGSEQVLHWGEVLEFFGGQFGVFGIISFLLLLYISIFTKFPRKKLLLSFTWMFLIVILIQALLGRANANWAAPAYVAGSIMVATWIVHGDKKKWLIALVAINLLLGGFLYYSEPIYKAVGVELTTKNDLLRRLRGWPEIGKQFSEIKKEFPNTIVLGEGERTILAHLLYQSRPIKTATWNPSGRVRHHFDLYNNLEEMKDETFLLVSKDKVLPTEIKNSFELTRYVGGMESKVYEDYHLKYFVYYLEGFKGY